jgi:Sperm-tail PG-rich repeat
MTQLRKVWVTNAVVPSKYDKISFRQKGWEIKGSLYQGDVVTAYSKIALGTIPCKIETVLMPVKANKKGFGIAEQRFKIKEDPEEVLPGPGHYHNRNYINQPKSFSTKGYGNGFISTDKRFRISNYYPYQVPGPGQYSEKLITKQSESSTFRLPTHLPKIKKTSKSPGPGEYDILNNSQHAVLATMRSNSNRFSYNANKNPSPDHYHPDLSEVKRSMKESNSSSNFKGNTTIEKPYKKIFTDLAKSTNTTSPGPGNYDWPLTIENTSKNLGAQKIKYSHYRIKLNDNQKYQKVLIEQKYSKPLIKKIKRSIDAVLA